MPGELKDSTPTLWRINLKPGSNDPTQDVTEFCVKHGIVGIGWPVDPAPTSVPDYQRRAKEHYKGKGRKSWSRATNAFSAMKSGDLIWTRNRKAVYYLGKITGDWKTNYGREFAAAEVVNVRPCDWKRVGTMDNVPGVVINAFRPAATVQRVRDSGALAYSQRLYARLRGEPLPLCGMPEILSMMSAEDLEDVVAIYLQKKRSLLMFPSSCKIDTMTVEYMLVSEDGTRFGVQVKSGKTALRRDGYGSFDGKVVLFAASGNYDGTQQADCECIEPHVIRDFVLANRNIMPRRIQLWIDYGASCMVPSGD